MASVKQVLGEVIGKLLFRELSVARVRDLAPRFRRIDLTGPALRSASFTAGDKLQVILEGQARTYTPFSFKAELGALSLLVYSHGGDSPGAAWGRQVSEGDRVRVFGPRSSIDLPALRGPVVLFGDETSFGLARVLLDANAVASAFVFEVSDLTDSALTLDHLSVPRDGLVARTPDDAHLAELRERLATALTRHPQANLVMTGRAPAIKYLRQALKSRPLALQEQRAKAYWAPGKRGLD